MGSLDKLRRHLVLLACLSDLYMMAPAAVTLHVNRQHVMIDNGILQLVLSNPEGLVTGIKYGGMDNVLEEKKARNQRGYWDVHWSEPDNGPYRFEVIKGTDFDVIQKDNHQVEVSFKTKWDVSLKGKRVPLNIDKRFVVLDGSSGFYTYAIYEHRKGWPDFNLVENRVAFKLKKQNFHYMAISDERQKVMPMPEDRKPGRSRQLAYPEAVLLTNPINPALKGQVDDKYQYSAIKEDLRVYGWTSCNPQVGFWMIIPSDEIHSGGPGAQDLTCHAGPIALAMFDSAHYAGEGALPKFRNGEYWKKVFGPVFIYLNSMTGSHGRQPRHLWEDAKKQAKIEMENWPYEFPLSPDFQKREQRGCVIGRLLIRDRYISKKYINGNAAYVGLAFAGEAKSWQDESKGHQFWTRADSEGSFSIRNVVTGQYDVYAWVPGFVGEYRFGWNITVTAGDRINLGNLVFEPPRDAPTLWEIGIPDRSAAEFFIPSPDPIYMTKIYLNDTGERFRQYGLWERYADLYKDGDLVYTIGHSDYKKDWFFAHVNRRAKSSKKPSFLPTTWRINFKLSTVQRTGTYKLRIALASASYSELQVRFNYLTANPPHFTTHLIGRDSAIARHGIQGKYWFFSIDVKTSWLKKGINTIFFTQSRCQNAFQGIMYDYIRMEGPGPLSSQVNYFSS